MTSHTRTYVRDWRRLHALQRALAAGNLNVTRAAAAELPQVGLSDALQVCLLLRDQPGDQFERAAVPWLGRFALEAREATLQAIQTAAAALEAMPERPQDSMESLAALCVRHQAVS